MKMLIPATAVALLALTACQSKTDTTTVNSTTVENKTVAVAPPVELPPSIKAEAAMRCHGDNSSIHVTFFEGDKMIAVQSPTEAPPVTLKAPEAGKPFVADGGWEATGNAKSLSLTQPGKAKQSCSV